MSLLNYFEINVVGKIVVWGKRGAPNNKETYNSIDNANARKKALHYAWFNHKLCVEPLVGLVKREFLDEEDMSESEARKLKKCAKE